MWLRRTVADFLLHATIKRRVRWHAKLQDRLQLSQKRELRSIESIEIVPESHPHCVCAISPIREINKDLLNPPGPPGSEARTLDKHESRGCVLDSYV